MHDQGVGTRAGPGVGDLSTELRSEKEVAAPALDPWRPARGAHRRLAFPLEHASLRGARLRGRWSELPWVQRLRTSVHRIDHRQLWRQGIFRYRSGNGVHAAAALYRSPAAGGG